jgi:hypothetical protein
VHDVVEEVRSLEHEAEVGQSARTPALVLGGVMAFLLVVLIIVLTVALLAYYLTK